MFQVVVIPNNTSSNLSLCYKTEQKAMAAHEVIGVKMTENDYIGLEDDFGNRLWMHSKDISYQLFIDVAKSQWREWEQMQCIERTRSLLGKRSPILAA